LRRECDSAGVAGADGNPGASAIVQDDGNFVIYNASNSPIWATGT
jgi:hypothetical protein